MLGMKRSYYLAIVALAFAAITLALAANFAGWRPLKRVASNTAISEIEEFRKAKGRLPNSLTEVGVEDDESCPCYCKTGDRSYIVWYGTTLGESDTYDSETRKWSDVGGVCAESTSPSLTK
jgi:hypothetical protein